MGETILIGLLFAIIFYELTDISPGGIIVPGILAYYLYDPRRIALTIGVALLAYLLVRLLSEFLVLYGRRKFVVHILVAVIIGVIFTRVVDAWSLSLFDIPLIGTIIAGIIANETAKQGIIKTYTALFVVVLLTGMTVWLL